ncbi:uncharacterized protein LOC124707243 [Lolium rigidum]|uniref:uncharacterized protein LOC124707243 n=1 Tax=Lolium rigidum TaxID=89674 RepID=UPI001F5DD282|nr:uncharacterized protein LOC124707243 [Lolium rigidum]
MSGFVGQRSWMGAAATPSEPVGGDARDDGAASSSSMNASAISFGFAATAILIAMFLLMAIFEHLIKPGWAAARASRDAAGDDGHAQDPSHSGRHRPRDHGSPDKLAPPPKMEVVVAAPDLTVVMPGQRYPTFLAQPAPLLFPCPREPVRWPPHHDRRHSFLPP